MKRLFAGLSLGGAMLAIAIWWWAGSSTPQVASARPLPPSTGARAGMVFVPGRTFEIGDTVYAEEGPTRSVTVGGFWMDRTEVTNAEFTAALARALRRPAPFAVPGFALKRLLGEFAEEGLLGGQRAVPAALERAGFRFHHNTIGEALSYALGPSGR